MTNNSETSSSTVLLSGGELDGDSFLATTAAPQYFVTIVERPVIAYDADCFCLLPVDEPVAPEVSVMNVLDPFEMRYEYELSHVDSESGNRIYVPR